MPEAVERLATVSGPQASELLGCHSSVWNVPHPRSSSHPAGPSAAQLPTVHSPWFLHFTPFTHLLESWMEAPLSSEGAAQHFLLEQSGWVLGQRRGAVLPVGGLPRVGTVPGLGHRL